jgi:hypothetical protein
MANTEANLQILVEQFRFIWLDDKKQREACRLARRIDEMKAAIYGPAEVG